MNNISEQLLQAMDIITEEKLRQLKYDKTIQATVYSIVDVDTGEYKLDIMATSFPRLARILVKAILLKTWFMSKCQKVISLIRN